MDEEFTETKETGSYEGSTRRVAEVQAYHPLEAQSGCRAARLEEGAIVFDRDEMGRGCLEGIYPHAISPLFDLRFY